MIVLVLLEMVTTGRRVPSLAAAPDRPGGLLPEPELPAA